MITNKNKHDNEVYILGTDSADKTKTAPSKKIWIVVLICTLLILAGVLVYYFTRESSTPEYYFEPEQTTQQSVTLPSDTSVTHQDAGYIEVLNDTINDVPLAIYIPHNATMSLQLGKPEKSDSTVIFAAMAADIRKDNQEIVGDFVLAGKKLARGTAKKGFCAIIDKTISIGVGENTPLMQEAIERNGFFFRQYPLVHNGEIQENKPKNKSIRRALAIRDENIVMIESKNPESFHDFTQALVDIGVTDAIYLVGGNAYGWLYDKNGVQHEFGLEVPDFPPNTSYIVWQTK